MSENESFTYRYFQFEGLKIRFAECGRSEGRQPLFIFGGIGQNIEVIEPLLAVLDQRIITFDVPGVGQSDTPTLPWRYSQHARVASHLLEELGVARAHILGISWGGGLAQQFARDYPERTSALVLAATGMGQIMVPGKLSAYFHMASLRRFWDENYLHSVAKHIYGGSVAEDAKPVDEHSERMRRPSQRGYIYQAMTMIGWSSLPWLRKVKSRTLILQGEHDPLIPNINARIMAALIPDSRIEFIDCGHLFMLTRLPAIAPIINGFLCESPEHSI